MPAFEGFIFGSYFCNFIKRNSSCRQLNIGRIAMKTKINDTVFTLKMELGYFLEIIFEIFDRCNLPIYVWDMPCLF